MLNKNGQNGPKAADLYTIKYDSKESIIHTDDYMIKTTTLTPDFYSDKIASLLGIKAEPKTVERSMPISPNFSRGLEKGNFTTLDTLFSDLMRQAQGGNSVSYEELLLTLSPIIRSFISRRISNDLDIDDILQNCLLGIHHASHTYNTDRSFMGWMFALVRYKVNDFLKSRYRLIEFVDYSGDDDTLVNDFSVTDLPTSSEVLIDLINDLPEKQREGCFSVKN